MQRPHAVSPLDEGLNVGVVRVSAIVLPPCQWTLASCACENSDRWPKAYEQTPSLAGSILWQLQTQSRRTGRGADNCAVGRRLQRMIRYRFL